jgi:DeoR family fructose operon transcriptional repressor
MATKSSIDASARLTDLRNDLQETGSLRIADAAPRFNVSQMTIRRDLEQLVGLGVARRVRGGAVAMGPAGFDERRLVNAGAKAVIAQKLVALVPERGAIGMDASTTILRLAAQLDGAGDVTVLTNSVETFEVLQARQGISPLITGGYKEPRTGSLVGPLAVRGAKGLLLSRYFLSSAALDASLGTSEACLEDAEVKAAFAAVSDETVLAVDSSKLGLRSVAPGLDTGQIDVLVTELDPGDRRLDPYRDIRLIL